MDEITISLGQVLWICGAIATIAAAVGVAVKATKPLRDLKKSIKGHERRIEAGEAKFTQLETDNEMILKSLHAILQHEAYGNHVNNMIDLTQELSDYIIKR